MSEEKKKYRVLKAVAISGIVQRGVIVELTEDEATNIGIGEYLEEVSDEEVASVESPTATDEAAGSYEESEDEGSEEQKLPEDAGSAEAGTGGEEGAGN